MWNARLKLNIELAKKILMPCIITNLCICYELLKMKCNTKYIAIARVPYSTAYNIAHQLSLNNVVNVSVIN